LDAVASGVGLRGLSWTPLPAADVAMPDGLTASTPDLPLAMTLHLSTPSFSLLPTVRLEQSKGP
jgi:hypothetical protein